jgi:hypothetical protein
MSYGLQVFNANGVLEVDSSSRLTRIVSTFTFNTASGTNASPAIITITYAGIALDGTWGITPIGMNGTAVLTANTITISKYASYDATTNTITLFRM